MTKKPQLRPAGIERPSMLPPPPPPRVESDGYYKAKIQELAEWLASEEATAADKEKTAADSGHPLREMYQSGIASMAFRARCWIDENIKGME